VQKVGCTRYFGRGTEEFGALTQTCSSNCNLILLTFGVWWILRIPSRISCVHQMTMTQLQACRPCAKRKVRCDRTVPCSNCKRRKNDHCTYPSVTPPDRVRELENLVRELGGNPNSAPAYGSPLSIRSPAALAQPDLVQVSETTPAEMRSNDPIILVEDGQMHYLES
jgi:hypothetical protein